MMIEDDAPAEATRDDAAFDRREQLLRALCVLLSVLVLLWGLVKVWAVHVAVTGGG